MLQLNIEIHDPDYAQKAQFFEFFLELLDDARYIPLVADTMLGHIRLFFFLCSYFLSFFSLRLFTTEQNSLRLYILNHDHPECRRRYIEKE